ncbi:MAG: anion transporter [Deltaproteobacteria bacterium]|nr:anion transporter [Deltaproteobacteria bacterium]
MDSTLNYIPLLILSGVFVLIAVRQIGSVRLRIWQIMCLGALACVLTGGISIPSALRSINLDVMFFLFGMFVVGEALIKSGYLYHVSYGFFKNARNVDSLVILILFVIGTLSAFLMNDTLAVIGTPLVLFFAEKHKINHKLLLLSLCFATTIGSVASPIGNPQNLLIAVGGNMDNPFVTFFKYLAVPTAVNLFLAYLVLKVIYKKHFHTGALVSSREDILDTKLAWIARSSLVIIVLLVFLKIGAVVFFKGLDFRLTYIAIAAALPVIILSPRRAEVVRSIDWHTLIFFAALFILMEGVWESGVIQYFISEASYDLTSVELILGVSVVLSQLLSNVPFVALYLPLLTHLGASPLGLSALAAGSTIAGNLLILGAASNVIIIQNAEKRGHTLTFMEFAKAGIPLTVLNLIVYWVYFRVI